MIPVGFNAKYVERAPDWLGNSSAIEILSVSGCISKDVADFSVDWLCNRWLLYDTERILDRALAGASEGRRIRRFYYETYERELRRRMWAAIEKTPDRVLEPEQNYTLRGFDVVCFSQNAGPECSPLSCNRAAERFGANQYCLMEGLAIALDVANEIDRDGSYEPGPYRVLSVWERDR